MVKRLLALVVVGVMLPGFLAAPVFGAAQDDVYRIGVGDVLSISVWRDESMSRQVKVLPDGTISYPLIGRVPAKGQSLDGLKQVITDRIRKYIPDPVISMEVVSVNSLKIYVIGKVNRPGRFELTDNIDVLQALALAGGLNAFARSSRVKIFRKKDKETRIIDFDYDAVSKGKQLETNIVLERGDVIVVP
jgi:polysaccharide biosynthesis/export protein